MILYLKMNTENTYPLMLDVVYDYIQLILTVMRHELLCRNI